MRAMLKIGFVGGLITLGASVSSAEAVNAWGPFAMLTTMVGVATAWCVTAESVYRAPSDTISHKRAAYKKAA